MQWQTLIVNSDNWVLGTSQIKDILIWSIQDRPWYNIRTYGLPNTFETPFQLKTNSWTSVDVNSDAKPTREIMIEKTIINARIKFFTELHFRLTNSAETLGLGDANTNMVSLYEYLIASGVLQGTAPSDAKVQYENKMRLLQDLNNIKKAVIDSVMLAKSIEDFAAARTNMERLFFTNILL
jgi:hypothetical protein